MTTQSNPNDAQTWRKWIPQLQEAMAEYAKAVENLEQAEAEITRLCYCIKRDEQPGRQV